MSTPGVPLAAADPENQTQFPEEQAEEDGEVIDLEKMWDAYEANPDFFHAIELAKDGGMSEASELIGGMRYISGVLPVVFVLLNIYSLYYVNLRLLLRGEEEDDNCNTNPPNGTNGTNGTDSNENCGLSIYMLTQEFILKPAGFEGNSAALVIASLEIFLISYYILRMFYWAYYIRYPGDYQMHRWQAVQEFFWNAVPECSSISAVKMLNFVTPAVIVPDLIEVISTSGMRLPINIGRFVLFRAIALIIGFDALLVKLQINTVQIRVEQEEGNSSLTLIILCVTFLNQILGVVQVGWFVRKRIFQFIFAGEDGTMSAEEEALKETWESMLAERIWRELKWHQALAAYLTYNDYDFQKLALETVSPDNAARVATKKEARAEKKAASTELIEQS